MKNHFDISGSIEIREVDIAGVACKCHIIYFDWYINVDLTACVYTHKKVIEHLFFLSSDIIFTLAQIIKNF